MTKHELKTILKLIEKNTKKVYGEYNDHEEMSADNIKQLKQDIIDLFGDSEGEE